MGSPTQNRNLSFETAPKGANFPSFVRIRWQKMPGILLHLECFSKPGLEDVFPIWKWGYHSSNGYVRLPEGNQELINLYQSSTCLAFLASASWRSNQKAPKVLTVFISETSDFLGSWTDSLPENLPSQIFGNGTRITRFPIRMLDFHLLGW